MQTIGHAGGHGGIVDGKVVIPDRYLKTGRVTAPYLKAVHGRQSLLERQENAQPGITRRNARRTQRRQPGMGAESVPDNGPGGIPQVHQGGVGRLDAIDRIGFILEQCL